MDSRGENCNINGSSSFQGSDFKKGPWTAEEDMKLVIYIERCGIWNWNRIPLAAGLNRTGKSCRSRWLHYLRPDLRRGNITLEEQLLIIELHSRWGNRWSKIAQYLPGRTDNKLMNYWRTHIQKRAKQIGYDVDSKQFKDFLRRLWIPRLLERIGADVAAIAPPTNAPVVGPIVVDAASAADFICTPSVGQASPPVTSAAFARSSTASGTTSTATTAATYRKRKYPDESTGSMVSGDDEDVPLGLLTPNFGPSNSNITSSSDSFMKPLCVRI